MFFDRSKNPDLREPCLQNVKVAEIRKEIQVMAFLEPLKNIIHDIEAQISTKDAPIKINSSRAGLSISYARSVLKLKAEDEAMHQWLAKLMTLGSEIKNLLSLSDSFSRVVFEFQSVQNTVVLTTEEREIKAKDHAERLFVALSGYTTDLTGHVKDAEEAQYDSTRKTLTFTLQSRFIFIKFCELLEQAQAEIWKKNNAEALTSIQIVFRGEKKVFSDRRSHRAKVDERLKIPLETVNLVRDFIDVIVNKLSDDDEFTFSFTSRRKEMHITCNFEVDAVLSIEVNDQQIWNALLWRLRAERLQGVLAWLNVRKIKAVNINGEKYEVNPKSSIQPRDDGTARFARHLEFADVGRDSEARLLSMRRSGGINPSGSRDN